MPALVRPSAITAKTSCSRGVKAPSGSPRRAPTSRATTSGSSAEPPRSDPSQGVEEVIDVKHAVLEQVPETPANHQIHRMPRLYVLRQHDDGERVLVTASLAT
jgi:hypothetical protein